MYWLYGIVLVLCERYINAGGFVLELSSPSQFLLDYFPVPQTASQVLVAIDVKNASFGGLIFIEPCMVALQVIQE